jgi:CysZ protein
MSTAVRTRNNPVSGAAYFLRGLSLITQKGVKRYVAIPLLINVLLFAAAIYYGWGQLELFIAWLEGYLPDWLDWLSWLLIPLFVLTAALVVFFGFAVLGNLIAAPFNGLLAEAVERKLTGRSTEAGGGLARLAKDAVASIASELRKLLYFALRAVPLLILSLIPVVNVAAPLLWFLLMAWMLTVEYADYPMGNHGITFPGQRKLLASRRYLSLGFGGLMTVVLMIPGLNFLVIPAGVAGATAMWVEQLSLSAPEA